MPRHLGADSGTGVSMPSGPGRAAGVAPVGLMQPRTARASPGVLAALALALTAAGCTTDGAPPGMAAAPVAAGGGPTVAFESIDGPPIGVFEKLVVTLSEEARSRQILVVSRESPASYRIRGFLAVHIDRGRPQVAWVWDVYDAEKRRALRIAGEEPGTRKGADGWGAADDQLLRRIARQSVDRLVAFLAAPSTPAAPPTPAPGDPRIATTIDEVAPAGEPANATAFAPR